MGARHSNHQTELAALDRARHEFNSFVEEHVRHTLGINKDDEDRLTFAEIARRIADTNTRREYARLAVAMLEANVRHHTLDASPISGPERSPVTPVVTALLAAAAGYYAHGPVLALFFAAMGYWVGYNHVSSKVSRLAREVEAHNTEVAEWNETLAGWHRSIVELHTIET